jgi:hypothetical protein
LRPAHFVGGSGWSLMIEKMEDILNKEYWKYGERRRDDIYTPKWAQMLIGLYTSPMKYEVMYKMRYDKNIS